LGSRSNRPLCTCKPINFDREKTGGGQKVLRRTIVGKATKQTS
ncbi:hypothetical protein ANCCAN_05167, partial [Ancylostoma caninum]